MSDDQPRESDLDLLRRAYSQWEDVQRVFAALDEARARVAVLEAALEMALIGGNHIACVLIGIPGKTDDLDHILAAPMTTGRRAELPLEVALWMVRPFAVPEGLLLDPFAGSGAILRAAEQCGMRAIGYDHDGG